MFNIWTDVYVLLDSTLAKIVLRLALSPTAVGR